MTLEESILDNIHSKKLGLPLSVLVSGAITYIVYGVLDVNGIQGYPVFKIVGSGNSTEYIAAGFLLESNRKDGANSSTADVNLKTDFENTLLLLQDPTIDYDGTGEFGYNPLDIPGLQLYLNKNLGVNTRVAAYFDGVNQYLSSASTDFNTTGSFSFGGWIYSTDLNKADPIMGKWGTGGRSYMLRREGDNTIGFFISSDGVDSSLFKSTYTTSLNTWHFVMGVYDSVNDLVKISFDGNSFENFPYTLGLYGSSTADLLFANFSGSGLHFNGRQDGMVFYNEALSLAEIQGLYNSGNGLAYNNVPTLLGTEYAIAQDFNGVDQYLSSASTDFDKTSESFSFGGWVKYDTLGVGVTFIGKWNASTSQKTYNFTKFSDDELRLQLSTDGSTNDLSLQSGVTLSSGTWYFAVAVIDKVNNLAKISVNGGDFAFGSFSADLFTSNEDLLFGNNNVNFLDGQIDSTFFYDKALTLAEIRSLYYGGNGKIITTTYPTKSFALKTSSNSDYFEQTDVSLSLNSGGDALSIAMWVDLDGIGTNEALLTLGNALLFTSLSDAWRMYVSTDGGNSNEFKQYSTLRTAGIHLVCCYWRPATKTMGISIDGSSFQTGTWSGTLNTSTNEFRLASGTLGNTDSVAVYRNVMSNADAASLWNGGAGKSYSDYSASDLSGLQNFWAVDGTTLDFEDLHGTLDLVTVGNPQLAVGITTNSTIELNTITYEDAAGITYANLPTLIGTEFAIGQSFNGTDSAFNIDSVLTPLVSTTTGTIEFDIKLSSFGFIQKIIVFGDTDGSSTIQIGISSTDSLLFRYDDGSGTQWRLETDTSPFGSGVWANVKVIQDGISPKIYINDVLVAQSFTVSTDKTLWFNNAVLIDNARIGCFSVSGSGNASFLDGSIQNLKIYTDATQTNLVAHYPLNNVEGADQIDIVGGYDATPIGLPISTLASVDNTTITDMETDLTAWWEMNDVEGACQSNLADTTVDNAAVFNGTTDAINIDAVLTPLASTTTGTWEFDVKVTDATPTSATELVTFGDTNASTYIQTWLAPDGKININIVVGGVAQWWLKTDGIPLTANVWANLKFIQDGISPKIYINDILVAQTFTVSTDKTLWFNDIPLLDNGRVACINTNSLGDVGFFDGAMQNVKIYSDATQTTLIAHYDFADKDDLGNDIVGGYDGTLIGTPYATPLNGDLVPNNTPVSVLGKVTDTTLPNMETDLVSWWELNETSGTRLDEVGANNLTDNNSVGYALGKIQENAATSINDDKIAADFDGTNYLDGASNYLDFSTFDVLSIQFWVKRQGVGAAPTMLGVWNNGANNTWRFRMNSSANTFLEVSTDGSNSVTLSGGPITPFNAWNCVSIYINKPTKEIGFSLNGGAFITKSFTGNIFESGTPFTIGGLANLGAANLFTGEVDSVHFWSRQLTNSEFTDLYNSGNGLSYSDFSEPLLVDYYDGWLLNERSGTRTSINEVDLESNNNVGYDVGKITNPTQVETLVSRWLDQSPNMFVLSQNVVTRQPLLSADSIDFDGVDDYLNLAISDVFGADSSGIIFFSWYFDGVNGQTLLSSTDLTSTSQRMSFGIRTTGNLQVVGKSTNLTWTTASCVVGFNYGWVRSNGTSWDISLNGVPNQPLTVFSGTNNGNWFADILNRGSLTVGADIDPTPTYGTGQSVKTIYSNAALTDEQIAQIDNFMSQP